MQELKVTGLDEVAQRLARSCRRVIQGCLREEEWRDADAEFAQIIKDGISEFLKGGRNDIQPM